jgi:hypothetical protein
MFDTARSFLTSHRDASDVVKRAQRFSERIPVIGQVTVPPPDQLAFYGVLGVLAGVGALEWPVAVAIGVGQAVMARHLGDTPQATAPPPADAAPAEPATPARRTPAKKTPAKKTAGATNTDKKPTT